MSRRAAERAMVYETVNLIEAVMERQGVSRCVLAKRLGVTPPAVRHMLSGRRNIGLHAVGRILEALDTHAKLVEEEE
jgi:predicted transcriptional regulator